MLIVLKPQTVEEILGEYPLKQVLLADPVWSSEGKLHSGTVLCAEDDERDVYAMLKNQPFYSIVIWDTSKAVPEKRVKNAVSI